MASLRTSRLGMRVFPFLPIFGGLGLSCLLCLLRRLTSVTLLRLLLLLLLLELRVVRPLRLVVELRASLLALSPQTWTP